MARAGETGPLWIAARVQEAGRGRRGNAWASLPGNLAASVLWPAAGLDPERLATLGFVAGVALIEAIEAACGTAPGCDPGRTDRSFRLKWPNDVLCGKRSSPASCWRPRRCQAGDARGDRVRGQRGCRAGCVRQKRSLTQGAGYATDAETVLELLADRLAGAARAWNGGRGFDGIRGRWLARAAGLGQPVAVRIGTETVRGRFEEIDEGGRLVMSAPDGARRLVTAGEVHFGTAATAA